MSDQKPTEALDLTLKPDINYFGLAQVKGAQKQFGILKDDRRRHMYILGKTGMGKSTLLQNMVLQDIYNGYGVCFLDPHGDSAEYILDRIPSYRGGDVIYFDPSDTDFPYGFNMLDSSNSEEKDFLLVSGMMAVFRRIWEGMWSSRMEYILTNTLLALLETPGSTLLGVVRMLTDKKYQKKIVSNVTNPLVKSFWEKEYASFNERYKQEAVSPILNKIGQFFSTGLSRNILGQVKSTLDFRQIMDSKKILIVNLSKGKLGEDNSALLGSFIVTKLQLAAMSRVDTPEDQRNDFFLYVDEFQNFTTDSFASILSEARKYRLSLILAHQYISQLTESGNEKIRNAIFGNVGTMLSFRTGSDDAEVLEKEFQPIFKSQQLIALNKTQVALRMSIEGRSSNPFLANTLPPIFTNFGGKFETMRQSSRKNYSRPKELVEKTTADWLEGKIAQEKLAASDDGLIPRLEQKNSNKEDSVNIPKVSSSNNSKNSFQDSKSSNPSKFSNSNKKSISDSALNHSLDKSNAIKNNSISKPNSDNQKSKLKSNEPKVSLFGGGVSLSDLKNESKEDKDDNLHHFGLGLKISAPTLNTSKTSTAMKLQELKDRQIANMQTGHSQASISNIQNEDDEMFTTPG